MHPKAKYFCPETCGFCGSEALIQTPLEASAECADKEIPNCPFLGGKTGTCEEVAAALAKMGVTKEEACMHPKAKYFCPETCGFCGSEALIQTPLEASAECADKEIPNCPFLGGKTGTCEEVAAA